MQKIFPGKKAAKKAFNLNIRQIMLGPLVFLLLVLFFFPGLALAAPVLSLSPLGGPAGTELTVSGSGFMPGGEILVWFDANRNGIKDNGEPSITVPSGSYGKIIATLTVPAGLSPGAYPVRAGLPGDGAAPANFTVKGPTLSLSPTKGIPGTTVTVTGNRFPANTPGWVWFDTNGTTRGTAENFIKK
ncbi:hypothetical protein HY02_00640 [Peptococcaceae bacterium SCADC1_2_3]|nr:hypothetical protein DK28_0205110 [Peptococcaceae bacterium SCADC1_2_3]KFI36762.1 hypothetical protein HY02_00640 [Peptococcaceae bacterium SCADC1_2_3]